METTEATKPTEPTVSVQPLRLGLIAYSPTNPRREKGGPAFDELKASIAALGVQVPVRVRPLPDADANGYRYELIMGERRLRACQALKLETIPAVIEPADDLAAFKAQLAENCHRQDLTALEEGAAFDAAITRFGFTREQLAEEFGVKRSTVYSRLRLHGLRPEVKGALAKHAVPDSIATLIATIPDPKEQVKAAKEIAAPRWGDEIPMNFREAQEHIEETYRKSLKGAPFDLKDATVHPGAGPCTTCPKRSGNLDPESPSPNVCTDPACYALKVHAAGEPKAQKLVEKGYSLLTPKQMKGQWAYGRLAHNSTFVSAKYVPWQDPKERTIEALMKGTKIAPVVAIDPEGEPQLLFSRDTVNARLLELKIVKPAEKAKPAKPTDPEKAKAAEAKAALEERVEREAAESMTAAIVKELESLKLSAKRETAVWAWVLGWLSEIDAVNHDLIAARRGWPNDAIQKKAATLEPRQVRALVVETFLAPYTTWDVERHEEVAELLGLDRKAIEKAARARVLAESKEDGKTGKPESAKAGKPGGTPKRKSKGGRK